MPIQCLILAGGLATRMRPLTDRLPKSLLDVEGEPFLAHQLRWLGRHGVGEALIAAGHLGEQIEAYLKTASPPLMTSVLREPAPLGTGGALRFCLDSGRLAERFLVTWGDSFLPVDHRQVWEAFLRSEAPALMTVFENQGRWDDSNVIYREGQIELYDKTRSLAPVEAFQFIDYGLMAFARATLEELPPGPSELAPFLTRLSRQGQLAGWLAPRRFYEIGSPAGLADFRAFVRGGGTR